MTHSRFISLALLLMAVGACGDTSTNTGDDNGSGPPYSGSNGDGGGNGMGNDDGNGDTDPTANVDPTYPTQHPRIYLAANKQRLQTSLSANTPAARRFKQIVDNWVGGDDVYNFSAWNAALMGQLTGQPQYCQKAVAAVEQQVSSAESAISGGGTPTVAGDSYLEVGPMIGDLALVYDWCNDTVTASQKQRWLAYANQAVWNVWHPNEAKWGGSTHTWTGWATNDPSDNYYYSFLRATMLLGLAEKGEDPQGDTWIDQFRQTKVLDQLIPTFDSDLVGGGSREGTGYGTAMMNLWSIYDFWKATTGEGIGSKTAHTRQSLRTMIHQIVPTLDRFAPTGDQSRDSTASMFDYQRWYLQELIALYPHDMAAGPAQFVVQHCSVPQMTEQFMAVDDFLYENPDVAAAPLDGMNTAHFAPGIGEIYSRSGWDTHATWVNMIAGPYTQSHAHQDQGSLMLFKDGWLAYDAVVDSASGLTQDTTAHSLVRIDNGGSPVRQVGNTISKVEALHQGDGWLYAAADLTPAYDGNSAVGKVHREMLYLQPNVVIVYDRVASGSGTSQTWQLVTPVQPSISGNTATITNAGHTLSVQRLAPADASATTRSMSSVSGDFHGGYRLDETASGGDKRYLHVLSIDGGATSATAQGDAVTVHLAGGKTATVTFDHDNIGATMNLDGTDVTLGAGVDTLAD